VSATWRALPAWPADGSPCLLMGCAIAVVGAFMTGLLLGILLAGARE
jgi:hypothetical protein